MYKLRDAINTLREAIAKLHACGIFAVDFYVSSLSGSTNIRLQASIDDFVGLLQPEYPLHVRIGREGQVISSIHVATQISNDVTIVSVLFPNDLDRIDEIVRNERVIRAIKSTMDEEKGGVYVP